MSPRALYDALRAPQPRLDPTLIDGTLVPVRELGRGGMGVVELVARVRGAEVELAARKRLLPSLRGDRALVARFRREIVLGTHVDDPHVLSARSVGEDDAGPFFLMDYVPGLSLADLMGHVVSRGERVPLYVLLEIGAQVASGLHALHVARDGDGEPLGLVHRDVSPGNVWVGLDGIARVCDLGLARPREPMGSLAITRADERVRMGKLAYLAPELFGYAPATPRSDVYALGVVLHEVIAHRRLLRGVVDRSDAERALRDARGPLRDDLAQLLAAMVARDPDARPRSAAEVAGRLRALAPASARLDAYLARELPHRARSAERELSALRVALAATPRARARAEEDPTIPYATPVPPDDSPRSARALLALLVVLVVLVALVLSTASRELVTRCNAAPVDQGARRERAPGT